MMAARFIEMGTTMPSSTHRNHLRAAALCIASLGLTSGAFGDDAFGPVAVAAAAQSFELGALQLVALRDAEFVVHNDGKTFGSEADVATVGNLLKASKLPEDRLTLSVNALLVRDGKRVILIDSGLGASAHGALLASLGESGVSPDQVTDVLITHSHFDHTGGLAGADGKLAFSKAVIRMSAAEWTWMKGQPDAAALVKVIDGHVQTFTPGAAIAPGVRSVALNGHTPGHVGYAITSGKQSLLDIGDMAHSWVVSLKKPGWAMQFDDDKATASATRKATFARLAKTHELVFAPHFPYPGVGHVVADADAYTWMPDVP
jgi:glyoxylase-like metal-dependent hydrolase (beta-lactamase superfamily II)